MKIEMIEIKKRNKFQIKIMQIKSDSKTTRICENIKTSKKIYDTFLKLKKYKLVPKMAMKTSN